MSEIQTAKIQTMLNSERKRVQISDIWAFGTTPQLSEIRTNQPNHNTHLNAIINALWVDGWVIKLL